MEIQDFDTKSPSVDSLIAEERISARRFRIKKNIEEAERLGQGAENEEEVLPQPIITENQMMKSDKFLRKIISDSSTLVTNVKKATELDEIHRVDRNRENDLKLKEKLEIEAKIAEEKFQQISEKWEETLNLNVPSELYEKLMNQKSACDTVISEKDKTIRELKQEIDAKASRFSKNVEREEEEIQITIDRAKDQIRLLNKLYNREINKIEDSLINEWRELFESQMKEWMNTLKNLDIKDEERLKVNRKLFEKCEQELDELRKMKADEYNKMRTELDIDAQILEQYLQQMKAHLQLNQEKLEYGYQVLRKRDEEQAVVRAQQKRKATKLQDALTKLKTKLNQKEHLSREKALQLEDDCVKTGYQIHNIHKKLRHFRLMEEQKFKDLWSMNDETARKLTIQITEIDQNIHQGILKLNWQRPNLFFEIEEMSKGGQVKGLSKKVATLSAPLRRKPRSPYWLFGMGLMAVRSRSTPIRLALNKQEAEITPEIRKIILLALAKEASFLVEKRTEKFTTELPENEQALIKLDGIFAALKIEGNDEIDALIGFLYKRCFKKSSHPEEDLPTLQEEVKTEPEVEMKKPILSVKLPPLVRDVIRDRDNGPGTMDTDAILKSVDEFLEKRSKRVNLRRKKLKKAESDETEITLDEAEIEAYFSRYLHVLPESRHQLWDTLLKGLEKLRKVEADRLRFKNENLQLQNQNSELKTMLAQYLRSRALG